MKLTRVLLRGCLPGLILAAAAAAAHADGDRRTPLLPLLPAYVQECGSCHVAYPPGLLPAASWQHLMAGLEAHHGSDASLDAATARTLSSWLAAHAGSGKRAATAPKDDRITQSAWFLREHREVQGLMGSVAVKRASDCGACHTQAAAGSYREREIRIPK